MLTFYFMKTTKMQGMTVLERREANKMKGFRETENDNWVSQLTRKEHAER